MRKQYYCTKLSKYKEENSYKAFDKITNIIKNFFLSIFVHTNQV